MSISRSLNLDAYIRVSQVGGRSGDSFISPTVQRERIESWVRVHGHTLTWHEPELDASGGTMSRPVFERIMERVRGGESDGVIVAKLDRFARTLVGALSTLEEFERHNAVLVSVADNIDLSTPMGKAFLRILLVFAELERDRITESWDSATQNAIARGIHIAKFTPTGYTRGPDKRLQPNDEAPAIREAFRMRAAHKHLTEVARRLDETAPRPNDGRWTRAKVDRIIKNRVYRGDAYRGQHVNRNAHPAIVSEAEWHAANHVPVRARPRSGSPSLLGGLVRCAGCRYLLAPHKQRVTKTGVKAPDYRCRTIHGAGECPAPASVNGHKLDKYVETLWRARMAQEAISVRHNSDALQAATETLTAAEEELAAFAADLTARRLLGDRYHVALQTRVDAVSEAQANIRSNLGPTSDSQLIEGYEDLALEDRRRILGSSINTVIVKRGDARLPLQHRVTVLWRGEGPEDLPRRGRDNGPIRSYRP
jgi:site-specific DNA recombinase